MPYGNNRALAKPRASFQTAGGTSIKLRHPILSGQIDGATPIDEVDVSASLRLNDTFLDAMPAQDNAIQEPLVDGSIITITNHLLAGTMTLQVMRTTGLVGTGDFIACAHLIIASKDSEGSTLTVTQYINGKRITTIFYGVAFKQVPHLKIAGNSVVIYPVTLTYAGWIQGVSANDVSNEKAIWAVGNKYGLKGIYKPYAIQKAEEASNFYGGKPLSESTGGVGLGNGDKPSGDIDNAAVVPDPMASEASGGMTASGDPATITWDT